MPAQLEPEDIQVSVVIPAFNEERALAGLLAELHAELADRGDAYELVVVDDGSTDGTAAVAERAGARVITHAYRMGNGAAVKSGLRRARGELIVTMDGDGQHRPQDVVRLLDRQQENRFDMVVGARSTSSQAGHHRSLANWVYNRLASYVVGARIHDLTSGLRVVRSDVVGEFIPLLPNTFSYPTTLTLALFRSGFSVGYLPIEAAPRLGRSKIRVVRDGLRFLLIIFKVCTLVAPLKIFLPASFVAWLAGLANYAYTFVTLHRFTNMSMLMLLFGVQLFLLGLIAEQITQLYYCRAWPGHR